LALLATPAQAQSETDAPSPEDSNEAADAAVVLPPDTASESADASDGGPLSLDAFTFIIDARLIAANGEKSWTDRGFGKARFDGNSRGHYKPQATPVEANIVWQPRFSDSLGATVSGAWQLDQENEADLIEAFLDFLPPQTGSVGFHVRAGLMWPEISLEHSTGGAWDVVDTITPSAINSWVGEETKVLGVEAAVSTSIKEHVLSLTGGVFGFNDTSGTLLSFRGWALHDERASAFGHFELPPLNAFMTRAQENQTKSLLEIDDRPGFYGRLDWRPPAPVGAALFYYDNRGDPEAFNSDLQWGWRTRFWNLGVNADIGSKTRVVAQGMTGSTIMGFRPAGADRRWVHTRFRSAFVLLTHRLDDQLSVSGRIEAFATREHGSRMSALESEDGWSWTAALRYMPIDHVTIKAEALNVRSRRPVRVERLGIGAFQAQTVFQLAVRFQF